VKKIFSILLALVLVVSLGLVTAAHVAAQSTVLDHFKCYRAWGMAPEEFVYLEDQFGAVEAEVEWAQFFCNPVAKWHEEMEPSILNWNHHLTLYSLHYVEHRQERIVKVENQFGTQQLVVSDPILLGVPTQKEGYYSPVGLDHFLLYEVTEGPPVNVVVGLEDQFLSEYVSVYEPVYFANPVQKTDDWGVTEIENPEACLVFYQIASSYSITGDVWVDNQFGEQYLEVYMDEDNPALLAVPSEREEQYTLTMAVAPAGTGTATDVTGASPYAEGATVSIEAVAATGYHFSHWTADPTVTFDDATADETTFTMPAADVTVTANFEVGMAVQYSLTISSTAGGSVTTPGEATFKYDTGEVVSLVATPVSGYGFVNWAGDVDTIAHVNAATTNITMEGDYELTARFVGVGPAKEVTLNKAGTVNARKEADTEVKVDGAATVTVAKYTDNPGHEAPADFEALGKWVGVSVSPTKEVSEIEIRLYYTDEQLNEASIKEESLRLFWWNGTAWVQCSDSDVNTESNYIWAKISSNPTPSLWEWIRWLLPWGGYGGPKEKEDGCFIATAAYDTDTAKEIDILREFRDEVLLPNSLGTKFVSLYYKISPPIADFISRHEVLRTAVRVGFVDPIVAMLNWSHHLWSARGS